MLTKNDIIQINKKIIEEWNIKNPTNKEVFTASQDRLDDVLDIVEKQSDLISQASYLMAAISWAQPFSGANKRTAFVCADILLTMNGYKLQAKTTEDMEYLRSLLFEIQESRISLDEITLAKIILYVTKRLKKA